MSNSLEQLMKELERKARERMNRTDAEATVYELSSTVTEGSATAFESEAVQTVYEKELKEHSKGTVLAGTYRIDSAPIHGGMGNVWRVHHLGWNTDLAMKRPQARLFQSDRQKENFIRECTSWIDLGLHPNIVSCYFVREVDGIPTIFSEWMEGGSLENLISSGELYADDEQVQQKRLLDIAVQFARGLYYSHEQGLIHQDVKPENVLLSRDYDAKVADFGLARARAQLTVLEGNNTCFDEGMTMFSLSGGYTPAYCSMEQMDGKPLTRRTDIYSWAVSIMEMYLGERPWTSGVVAGLSCEEYLNDCRVTVPDKLKDLLKKCMAAEQNDRPHDFKEIIAVLYEIYFDCFGRKYPRADPKAAADTAPSLNNRAISFIELGKIDEAEKLLDTAIKKDPSYMTAQINQSILLWNIGKINDVVLKDKLASSDISEEEREPVIRMLERNQGSIVEVPSSMRFGEPRITISPNSKRLVVNKSGKMQIFELPSGELKDEFVFEEPYDGKFYKRLVLASSDNAKFLYILTSLLSNDVGIYDTEKKRIIAENVLDESHARSVKYMELSRDQSFLVAQIYSAGDRSCELQVLDSYSMRRIAPPVEVYGRSGVVPLSRWNGIIVAGYDYNKHDFHVSCLSYDLKTVKWVYDASMNENIDMIAVSPDGRTVCCTGCRGGLTVLDAVDGKLLRFIELPGMKPVLKLGFLNGGKNCVCTIENKVFILDCPNYDHLRTFSGFCGSEAGVEIKTVNEIILYHEYFSRLLMAKYCPGDSSGPKPYILATAWNTAKSAEDEAQYHALIAGAKSDIGIGKTADALDKLSRAFAGAYRDTDELEKLNDVVGKRSKVIGLRYCHAIESYPVRTPIPTFDPDVKLFADTNAGVSRLHLTCSNGTVRVNIEQACRIIINKDDGRPYVSRLGPITAMDSDGKVKLPQNTVLKYIQTPNDQCGASIRENKGFGYILEKENGRLSPAKYLDGYFVSAFDEIWPVSNGRNMYAIKRYNRNGKFELVLHSPGRKDTEFVKIIYLREYEEFKGDCFFSPNGNEVFIVRRRKSDYYTERYRASDGNLINEYPGNTPVIARFGRYLATTVEYRPTTFNIYDVESAALVNSGKTSAEIRAMALTSDSRYLFIACDGGSLLIYDTKKGACTEAMHTSDGETIYDMAISDDDKYLIVKNRSCGFKIYRLVWEYGLK